MEEMEGEVKDYMHRNKKRKAMKTSIRPTMMLVALLCATSTFAMTTVRIKQAGTLGTLLTPEQLDTCTALAIWGKLNSADIKVLRRMAGGDGGDGHLGLLDLSKAKI